MLIREFVVVFCFAVCFAAPSFLKVIGFVGSFLFLFLGVVLPGVLYLVHFREFKNGCWQVGMGVWITVTVALWIGATYYSVKAEV